MSAGGRAGLAAVEPCSPGPDRDRPGIGELGLGSLSGGPVPEPVFPSCPDQRHQRSPPKARLGAPHWRRCGALDNVLQSSRRRRSSLRRHAQPECGRPECGDGREDLEVRPFQAQQREDHTPAEPRRDVLERRAERAHIPLRQRPGLRDRCAIRGTDPLLRQGRLHRLAGRLGSGPRWRRAADDDSRGGVQRPADPRRSRERDIRILARARACLQCRDRRDGVDLPHDPRARGDWA